MEQEGAVGREGSAPAGPSPTAFSFISLQACLRKGEGAGGWIGEFSFVFEKRNHLAVGEKKSRPILPGHLPWPGSMS